MYKIFIFLAIGVQIAMAAFELPVNTVPTESSKLIEQLRENTKKKYSSQQEEAQAHLSLAQTYLSYCASGETKTLKIMENKPFLGALLPEFATFEKGIKKALKEKGPLLELCKLAKQSYQRAIELNSYIAERPSLEYYYCFLEYEGSLSGAREGFKKIFTLLTLENDSNSHEALTRVGERLIRLLDHQKDEVEIKKIRAEIQRIRKLPMRP